jgi:hypothetical protein
MLSFMSTRSFVLQAHASTPCALIAELRVVVERAADRMRFDFEIRGEIQQLEIPAPAQSRRTDGLWQHTCCEAFLRPRGEHAYQEWNFSPSSEWAAYAFDGYRAGMRPLTISTDPIIVCDMGIDRLRLTATIERATGAAAAVQMGLSAVLRDRRGKIYYYALQHAPETPDFHHDTSFAALL